MYVIALIKTAEVDDYINKNLSENKLWQALMAHHEAIKEFMIKDTVYNPLYLKKAFGIVGKNDEKENWNILSDGYKRRDLLNIHGVRGVQACSPTLVVMLFATGRIWRYYKMNESDRKKFSVDRDCKFKDGGKDVLGRSVVFYWFRKSFGRGSRSMLRGRGGAIWDPACNAITPR